MPPVFHHATCQFDRILDNLHGCHRAGRKRTPFHDRRIHLYFAETVEGGAGARVKERVVFENDHSGCGGIERRTALLEYSPAGERSVLTAFQSLWQLFVENSSGAPVDNDGGPIGCRHVGRLVRGRSVKRGSWSGQSSSRSR